MRERVRAYVVHLLRKYSKGLIRNFPFVLQELNIQDPRASDLGNCMAHIFYTVS